MQFEKIVLVLFTVTMFVGGLYRLYKAYVIYRKVIASATWPQTFGTITEGKIKPIARGIPIPWSHNWAEFRFTYKVQGSGYNGEFRIHSFLGFKNTAARDVEERPVGITLPVHYNPQKPGECTTEYDRVSAYEWTEIIEPFVAAIIVLILGLTQASSE